MKDDPTPEIIVIDRVRMHSDLQLRLKGRFKSEFIAKNKSMLKQKQKSKPALVEITGTKLATETWASKDPIAKKVGCRSVTSDKWVTRRND